MALDVFTRNLRSLASARGGLSAIPFERLRELLADLDGLSVSEGSQSWDTDFTAVDMAWNHMDFAHRPSVHGQYVSGLRVAVGADVAVGFTQFLGNALLIPTFDVRVSDGEFLHGYCIVGLFYVFLRIRILPGEPGRNTYRVDRLVASKWLLRPLHGLLHRQIHRLNDRLFDEDAPIKTRRRQLRESGYRFAHDEPDFLGSSQLAPPDVVPPAAEPVTIALDALPEGRDHVLASGPRRFLVRRSAGAVQVWDEVCPHQGGPLAGAAPCDAVRVCPWHGLKIPCVTVSEAHPSAAAASFRVSLAGGQVTISAPA